VKVWGLTGSTPHFSLDGHDRFLLFSIFPFFPILSHYVHSSYFKINPLTTFNDVKNRGVNCIAYYPGGDNPYIVSGSDDRSIKGSDFILLDDFLISSCCDFNLRKKTCNFCGCCL